MKWTKLESGAYNLDGTNYGVRAAYETHASDGHYERTGYRMAVKTEWAAIVGNGAAQSGTNLEWFDTMREAREYCERLAEREER